MTWLWVVLYFLIGFIIDICFIVYDIKNGNFNTYDDDNIIVIILIVVLWPFIIVALGIVGVAKFIMFLGRVISEWIS